MEECRAWTKEPVLRTFQVQMMAQTLLRLMQFRLARRSWRRLVSATALEPGQASCVDPRSASAVLETSSRFSQVMAALDDLQKPPQTKFHCGQPTSRAA